MSLIDMVKEVEPRQRFSVPSGVADDLLKVIEDWKKKNNDRAPSQLESNLIRERLDKALEPVNMLRDPNEHIKAWIAVEGLEMLCWFTLKGKRVALIDMGDKPS